MQSSASPLPSSSSDPSGGVAKHPYRPHHTVVLNSIDQGFCVIEVLFDERDVPVDYRFMETNAAFAQQTGLENVVGRRIRELVPGHEAPWFDRYGQVALTGEPCRFEDEARSLNQRWFDVYAFRVDPPEKRHVAVLFRDITERRRAEEAARLLSDVAEVLITLNREADLPDIIRVKAAPVLHLSQCAFVELDLNRHEAHVSRTWDDPAAPAVAGTHRFEDFVSAQLWQEVAAGRTVAVTDVAHDPRIPAPERFQAARVASFLAIPLRQKSDVWRNVFLLGRAEAVAWRQDEIELARELGLRCWTRVERLRAELALSASEEQLRLILESAREYAIFTMDLERRVTSWSEGAERLLGFRAEEIMGQSADQIFLPEDVAAGESLREARVAMTEGRAANERWHLRKDGSRFWGSGAMMVMQDEEGVIYGLLKIMRDQTDVRLAQEALLNSQRQLQDALELAQRARGDAEAATRAKDRFLAALSHELRTPLNPVMMIAQERAGDREISGSLRAEFEVIRRNIELEARLIDDMLDLNRISRGKLTLRRSPIDLHVILREILDMVRSAAVEKSLDFKLALGSPRSAIDGDAARVKQIFLNLFNNAIKFTPVNGTITVTTELVAEANEIHVEIVDTGLGMTEEELARAFEPFVQGEHAHPGAGSFGGLGLGLAIVYDLVSRHGGRVSGRSQGRGRGAAFSVYLPLTLATPLVGETPGQPAAPAAPAGLRILLVEDHLHTRLAMENMLRRRQHHVVAAVSQHEAVAAASRASFEFVISDIGLPDGDGYQLMTALRALQPAIRGIALSGYGMESDVARSAAAGFSQHLVKPVTMPKLEAAITQVLGTV